MNTTVRILSSLLLCLPALLLHPGAAEAQWYTSVYLGANHTPAADVTIEQPSANTSLRFRDVSFSARPFASPQYYGIRIGRLVGERRRLGVELEFIHLKVIGETGKTFEASGTLEGAEVQGPVRMDSIVQQYAMTHGLNFFVINLVSKHPTGRAGAFVVRLGAGGTMPHAESTVRGVNREQYEYGGPGFHTSAGYEAGLTRWTTAFVEYKLTAARPAISIAAGTGRTTSVSHHIAAGFTFGSRR